MEGQHKDISHGMGVTVRNMPPWQINNSQGPHELCTNRHVYPTWKILTPINTYTPILLGPDWPRRTSAINSKLPGTFPFRREMNPSANVNALKESHGKRQSRETYVHLSHSPSKILGARPCSNCSAILLERRV